MLGQLQKSCDIVKTALPEEYADEAQRLRQQREELNSYRDALYRMQPFGITLYDAITRYFQAECAKDTVKFQPDIFSSMNLQTLRAWGDTAKDLCAAAEGAGEIDRHPLSGIRANAFTMGMRDEAQKQLQELEQSADICGKTACELIRRLDLTADFSSIEQYRRLSIVAALASVQTSAPPALLKADELSSTISTLRLLCNHGAHEQALRKKLLGTFSDRVFLLDAPAMLAEWQTLSTKWFLPKLLGQNRIYKLLCGMCVSPGILQKADVPQALANLTARREALDRVGKAVAAASFCGSLWKEEDTSWADVVTACEYTEKLSRALSELTHDASRTSASLKAVASLHESNGSEALPAYIGAFENFKNTFSAVCELLHVEEDFIPAPGETFTENVVEKASFWRLHLSGLHEWCIWNRTREAAKALGLSPLTQAFDSGSVTSADALTAYHKGLYRACVDAIISGNNTLSGFSGRLWEEKVRRFRESAHRLEGLTRREIFAQLASRIPDFTREAAQSSEVGQLKRAIRSVGRGTSIRRLFSALPKLLPRICPCMLMSPMSVAQYLDPTFPQFDLVVFDEASQLPTSEAVGAIARGKNAVIVGDPKQLPPTSFFMTNRPDEEHADSEDMESILDDCLALSMPELHLLWHYRSRHESLITFSNSMYYENRLLTFPSPNNLVSKVRLVPLEGYYDRGKTKQNRAEAEAVVGEISRRLSDPSLCQKSIGVVTFSSVQQELIDDLLGEMFREHPELEEAASHCYEPIIIKNLENVQGDERDVILFSVGYGPDENGKMCHNFGPINQAGGWRRLNVAVSRAREEMVVYSVLRADQIDLSHTGSDGVAGLKAFLEFASHGLTQPNSAIKTRHAECLAAEIARHLSDRGLNVHTDVGTSRFRVDVAVVHPQKPREYILGISCNGEAFRDAETARDREFLQQGVLKHLGWNLMTVWPLDWWENPEKQTQNILEAVSHLLSATEKTERREETAPIPTKIASAVSQPIQTSPHMEAAVQQPCCRRIYRTACLKFERLSADEFCLPVSTPKIIRKISAVIDAEGPVCEAVVCRRVLQSFGISRLGSRLEQRLGELFPKLPYPCTRQQNLRFFWPEDSTKGACDFYRTADREEARRLPEDLPFPEIACAVKSVLQNQMSMPKEDLVHETARELGYTRVGAEVEKAMLAGIRLAVKNGWAETDDSGYISVTA